MRKIVVGSVLVLLLAAVGGVLVVALNLDPLINEQREKIAAIAAEQLGRQVSFGPVRTTWKGGLGAELTEIQLSAADPQAPSMVVVDKVTLKVDLWKAVLSMGKTLEVEAFVLQNPVIRLKRNADGTWNFQDILDHLAKRPPSPEEPTEETPSDGELLKGLKIAGVGINGGRIEINDEMLNRNLVVDGLTLAVSPIQPGKNVTAKLDLILNDGASNAPFHLEASVKPLPENLDFSTLPAMAARTTLGDLDLAPWGALLPKDAIIPAEGHISLDLTAVTDSGAENANAKGFISVEKLVLGKGASRGQKSDLRVDLDADANLKKQSFVVRRLDVTAPSVTLKTRVDVNEPTLAGIKNADVALRVSNLERVVAILPAGSGLLPKELTLEGPFEVDLKGDASAGNLRVDLDRAHLAWKDAMDKKAGTPLHLKVVANRAGDRIKIPTIELQLDTASLTGTADVSTKKGAPIQAELDTGPVVLASLRGMFPPFANALSKGQSVDGVIRLQANAKAQGDKQELHAKLALKGMNVDLDATQVRGDGIINLDVTPEGAITTAGLDANLTGLSVEQLGEKDKPVFEKPMGFPTEILVKVVKDATTATVKQADVKVGSTLVSAQGKATGLDTKAPNLDVKVEKLDVAFDDVRTLVAAASVLPKGGHLTARVAAAGNPNELKTLNVTVNDLNLLAAKNRVSGNATVRNLADPELDVKLETVDLNFDELRKLAANDAIPAGGYLKAKVYAKGRPSQLSTMKVAVEELDTSVYNSRINGYARIDDLDRPNFDIQLRGDKLDINHILAKTGGGKEEPKKKDEPKGDENAKGLPKETRETLKRFNGKADVALGQVLYDQYVFKDFTGVVRVKDGVITFEKLALKTFDGTVDASGTALNAGAEVLGSDLKLKVRDLDLGKAVDAHTTKKGNIDGRIHATLDVQGKGMGGKDLLHSLAGPISVESKQVSVKGFNLLYGVNEQIAKVVPLARSLKGPDIDPKKPTALQDLAMGGKFEAGRMIITRPIATRTPMGSVSLEGVVHFDSRLNLLGTAEIQPDVVGKMTGGKFKPPRPVRTPVRIGGTWNQPMVEHVDVGEFVKAAGLPDLVGQAKAAAEAAHKALEEQAAAAKAEAERLRKEAEERAKAEAARAAEQARKQAEDAKRKAEEAIRRQQEDARKKAEEARKRAEDEARKKAEEARKKAEEEAKRRLEEEKKKAQNQLKNLFK